MRSYAPSMVLAVWTLLLIAGAPHDETAVAFLLVLTIAVTVYVHDVRDRLRR